MSFKSRLRRGLGQMLVSVLGLGMFVPVAFAANPLIQNVTISPTPFYSNVPGQTAELTVEYDYNTGGYATGPVSEQIIDAFDNVVYDFGVSGTDDKASGHYILKWDGKCNVTYPQAPCTSGEYVQNGKYVVFLHSQTASPPAASYMSSQFDVAQTVAPVVELTSNPAPVYYKDSGDYAVNYTLTRNSGNDWIVRLKIKSTSGGGEAVIAENVATDGNKTIKWDGKINGSSASVGSYTYDLWATASVNGYSVESNHITGNFGVTNPNAPVASVNGLNVSPSPYDPNNGYVNLSYTLSNSSGSATINASVYSADNLNTALKSWALNNQSNGSNTLTWDGKDAFNNKVPNGAYIFKVGGYEGYNVIITQETNFTVSTLPPSENCAGFSDVSPSDPDCAAIAYVKSIGAMTGNPDGTFKPLDLLQRDQIMKIVLETFDKFDKQTDYCAGSRPFPDVSEIDWSYQYICRAKNLGITTGYLSGPDAGFYRPARTVNRVEFLALVLRNLVEQMPSNSESSYDDVAVNQWFSGYAKYAFDNNLFAKPNLFPTNFMIRAEVARVLYKLHQLGKI